MKPLLNPDWKTSLALLKIPFKTIAPTALAVVTLAVSPTNAQVIPDDTLRGERSTVRQDVIRGLPSDRITGGARRGNNLFHSFRQFDVPALQSAYFENPAGVQNIFSRVTGGDRSEIFGRLGVIQAGSSSILGNANLFFLNPNGVLFGPTASLDTGGSFAVTTANAIGFGDQGNFSATNPEIPSDVLTIHPSAFLFNQLAAQPTHSIEIRPFLSVPEGRSLLFVGGNIAPTPTATGEVLFSGGRLRAPGGRIEIAALAAPGSVGITVQDGVLQLNFPPDVARSDVSFVQSSSGLFVPSVDVTSGGGGEIRIYARNLNILDGADLCAGIGPASACGGQGTNRGFAGSQAGDVELDVQETLNLASSGSISNNVNAGSTGNSGNIRIRANSIAMENSFIETDVFRNAVGNAGNIDIRTSSITLTNEAQITSATGGIGNSGNIYLEASQGAFFSNSSIVSEVIEQQGRGKGGDITINAGRVELREGSAILADTEFLGDAGNITIVAPEAIILVGEGAGLNNPNRNFASQISSSVDRVTPDQDTVTGNSVGVGRGGDISISTGRLLLRGDVFIRTATSGIGDAGSLRITSDQIRLDAGASIQSDVRAGGVGRGGDIDITARTLRLLDGSQLTAGVVQASGVLPGGNGRGGNIRLRVADSIRIFGIDTSGTDSGVSSGVFTRTGSGSAGRAGNVLIQTERLQVANGAVINAQTENGNRGGEIRISADVLALTNGGQILTNTRGAGQAGNVHLNVLNQTIISGLDSTYTSRLAQFGSSVVTNVSPESGIFANTESSSTGNGGTIDLQTQVLSMQDNARLTSSTSGEGDAGDILIRNAAQVTLASESIIETAVRSDSTGQGGNIRLQSQSVVLNNRSRITAASESFGTAGDIAVEVQDRFEIEDSEVITTAANSSGGNIQINVQQGSDNGITIIQNGDIRTDSRGNGGNITVGGFGFIASEDSDIIASSRDAAGGQIEFALSGVFFEEGNQAAIQQGINRGTLEDSFNGNGSVNVISTGRTQGGTITLPDTSFIQNSLADLSENAIDPDALIANSCIARTESGGTFLITGTGGLPTNRPDALPPSAYPTDTVRTEPDTNWQPGDPIIEPQAVYQLPNGELVLSHECR